MLKRELITYFDRYKVRNNKRSTISDKFFNRFYKYSKVVDLSFIYSYYREREVHNKEAYI